MAKETSNMEQEILNNKQLAHHDSVKQHARMLKKEKPFSGSNLNFEHVQ